MNCSEEAPSQLASMPVLPLVDSEPLAESDTVSDPESDSDPLSEPGSAFPLCLSSATCKTDSQIMTGNE